MFYCEPCRVDFAWPETISRSRGKCEVCGQHATCYDRQSASLPNPAACETTSGCVYGRGHQRRGMEPCRVEGRFVVACGAHLPLPLSGPHTCVRSKDHDGAHNAVHPDGHPEGAKATSTAEILASLSPERALERATEQGYDARSTTTSEGRSVQVTMTADFARQVAYSLTERIVAVGEETKEGRWLKGFVAELVKVNP